MSDLVYLAGHPIDNAYPESFPGEAGLHWIRPMNSLIFLNQEQGPGWACLGAAGPPGCYWTVQPPYADCCTCRRPFKEVPCA